MGIERPISSAKRAEDRKPISQGDQFLNTQESNVPHAAAVGAPLLDRLELIDNLNSYGRHLTTESVVLEELAKGVGFALLALAELMRGTPAEDASNPPPESFKAKANRW